MEHILCVNLIRLNWRLALSVAKLNDLAFHFNNCINQWLRICYCSSWRAEVVCHNKWRARKHISSNCGDVALKWLRPFSAIICMATYDKENTFSGVKTDKTKKRPHKQVVREWLWQKQSWTNHCGERIHVTKIRREPTPWTVGRTRFVRVGALGQTQLRESLRSINHWACRLSISV